MKYILISSVIYAALLASTISSPVGPSHYGGPHSSNSLHRSGGYHQGRGSHTERSRGAPYGGPSHLRAQHVPSATFGSPYGAPGPRHIPGPVSTHGDLSRSGPYGGTAGAYHQGSSSSYHQGTTTNYHQGPSNGYHQGPSSRYSGGRASSIHGQGPTGSSYHHGEAQSQNYGREMKYTVKDPYSRGTTHVTETHVVTNRQMHGAEAEAAMKKIMGSMGPGGGHGGHGGGFSDFVKDMGLPFY